MYKVSPWDVTLLARRVLRTVTGELRCICAVIQTTTNDDARRQRPLPSLAPFTMCKRVSHNGSQVVVTFVKLSTFDVK